MNSDQIDKKHILEGSETTDYGSMPPLMNGNEDEDCAETSMQQLYKRIFN